ncbi:MAG: GDSL-type esterase/lipase family protein [Fusobacteriaceae bacterium]|jgi:lysophospholipase L1-like esterase|nr:GDSL-type esterase/lipase family protein [Fusobacteriaceae bacterium]
MKLDLTNFKSIVCFGDSITYGFGAYTEAQSWPSLLAARVTVPVINAGVNGETAMDGLWRIEEDVLAYDPAVVIINFGMNDFYSYARDWRVRKVDYGYRQMLARLRAPGRQIYVARFYGEAMKKTYDPSGEFDEMYAGLQKDFPEINMISDIWNGVFANADAMYDEVHPNENGYEIIFWNIFREIRPLLEENGFLKTI